MGLIGMSGFSTRTKHISLTSKRNSRNNQAKCGYAEIVQTHWKMTFEGLPRNVHVSHTIKRAMHTHIMLLPEKSVQPLGMIEMGAAMEILFMSLCPNIGYFDNCLINGQTYRMYVAKKLSRSRK
jgi:hypothetical protein